MTPNQHELLGKFVLTAFCAALPVSMVAAADGLYDSNMTEATVGGAGSLVWGGIYSLINMIIGDNDEKQDKVNSLQYYRKPEGKFLLGL